MLALQLLRYSYGFKCLVLAVPDLTGQRNATGDDMNMVVISILMPHSNPLGIRREAHALHEIRSNVFPPLTAKPVTHWQRQ
jgi:hypothetical protein